MFSRSQIRTGAAAANPEMLGSDDRNLSFFERMKKEKWHKEASDSLWQYLAERLRGLADTAGPLYAWTRLGGDGVQLLMEMLRPDPGGRLIAARIKDHP